MALQISPHFHEASNTVAYLVWDDATRQAALIDPVLDFDAKSCRTATVAIDAMLAEVEKRGLDLRWSLETHAHADHFSAATVVRRRCGARTVIGAGIAQVQKVFKPIFDAADLATDGSAFDHLVQDGERLPLGDLEIEVIATPGHTPACVSYRINDAVFVGDTLFMPDYGTARCDFPGGDAATLYRSIRRLLSLPPETRLFMCHDYKAPGRDVYAWETTVAAQRAKNVHVHDDIDEAAFVAMREARDRKLDMPALILPSVQVNIRAGELPPPAANGIRYLKLPVNEF